MGAYMRFGQESNEKAHDLINQSIKLPFDHLQRMVYKDVMAQHMSMSTVVEKGSETTY